jgi:hypothetical protein
MKVTINLVKVQGREQSFWVIQRGDYFWSEEGYWTTVLEKAAFHLTYTEANGEAFRLGFFNPYQLPELIFGGKEVLFFSI